MMMMMNRTRNRLMMISPKKIKRPLISTTETNHIPTLKFSLKWVQIITRIMMRAIRLVALSTANVSPKTNSASFHHNSWSVRRRISQILSDGQRSRVRTTLESRSTSRTRHCSTKGSSCSTWSLVTTEGSQMISISTRSCTTSTMYSEQ